MTSSRRWMAHKDDGLPTTEDWKALFWLIAFAVILIAITAVEGPAS